MVVEVVAAKPELLPDILELEAKCFVPGDPLRVPAEPGELADDVAAGEVLVALTEPSTWVNESAALVGWLSFRTHDRLGLPAELPSVAYVSSVGVAPEARRQGIARLLLRTLLALRPDDAFFSFVHPGNTASMQLFLNCGFGNSAYIPDLFGPTHGRNLLTSTPPAGQWRGRTLVSVDGDSAHRGAENHGAEFSPTLPHGDLRLAAIGIPGGL